MKKHKWIFLKAVLIITIVLIINFQFFLEKIEFGFTDYYSNQLDSYGNIISKTVKMAASYTDTYEQLLTDDLYYRLSGLNEELKTVPFEAFDAELLNHYKEKYNLHGLAIFIKKEEEISIYNSTIKEEIGAVTSDWGYWNDAFHSLFKEESPTVGKGIARGNFWVGPRSRSYHLDGFYRFAYYYNKEQNYLINGFIEDNNTYNTNVKNLLDDLFVYFNDDISYIKSISLIDLSAWEKAYYNNFKNPEDPAFIYGNFNRDILIQSKLTPQELYSIDVSKRLTVNYQGSDKSVFLINAGDNEHKYMIAALINDHDKQLFRQQAGLDFAFLTIFTIIAVLLGIFYVMKKYSSLLTFQIDRNNAMEEFSKNISSLPEFVYKCKMDSNGNILLTYNDGRVISQDKYVALESNYRLMTAIYPTSYVDSFKMNIMDVFKGSSKRFEINYNGEHYEHFVSPIFDENKKVIEIIGFATNITDRRIAEEQSKYLATHDSLTGLKNRVAFEEYVKKQLEIHSDASYAIMFLDLDKFKDLNDTLGHIVGDIALQEVANRIKEGIYSSRDSLVARMGGDEFAIFLPFTQHQEPINMAEKIIDILSKPYIIKENHISLGVSIGISIYNKDSSIYKQLLHFADMAMYEAKSCCESSYKFFSKEMLKDVNTRYFEA